MTVANRRAFSAAPELPASFRWRRDRELVWIETTLPGARAAFSTRLGGHSQGPYRSLNLGILTGDDPGPVARNRSTLAAALERDPENVTIGRQVHGVEIQCQRERLRSSAYTSPGSPGGELPAVDGQATDRAELTPLVLVADCVPVVLSAPGAVAVVHCGWRGVSAGIVPAAAKMVGELASAGPHEAGAALGPGIGPCCYQVGEEVADAFRARGHRSDVIAGKSLDLPSAIRLELEWAGLRPESITGAGLCTNCHPELFFSHRRGSGVTGRQAGLAWLTP